VFKKLTSKSRLILIIFSSIFVSVLDIAALPANEGIEMITIDQRINESLSTKSSRLPCRRKNYGIIILFTTWLAYSAFALGWAILDAPSGLQCTNHIK